MIELYINQLPNNNFNMNKSKKNECLNTLKEVKRVCKVVGFSAGSLKGLSVGERKKND